METIFKRKRIRISSERMLSIGKIVRSERLSKGFTQQQLAYLSGIDCCTISNIENGLTEQPKLPTLFSICDTLNVHINVFFIECKPFEIKMDE